ncbi:MAG: glycosyltransferase family 39 protein [Acidobacteria bacterium]|nr:glycosyltransferase family 39 protein [Acidobacteriota bacterium]
MNLDLILFVLSHYSFLGLLALFACLIGVRVTRSVAYDSASEKFSFCTGLGLGIIGSGVFFLGLLHLLIPAVILGLFGIAPVLLWPTWKEVWRDVKGAWRRISWKRLILYGIAFVLVIPVLLLPLYPPVDWDATAYHLAVAKIFAKSNAVVLTPYLRFPVFPLLNEMLFTLALVLYDDLAAHLVQFLMMVVVATTLYAWGQRAFNARVGLWSAALWLSNPLILFLGASAYIEAGLAMFLVLAIYAFFNWFHSGSTPWLLVSAALFGFSAGHKYLALFPILIACFFIAYLSLRERKLRNVVAFVAILLVVAGPWYLRNAYYTGNPIWPYWGSWLGYGTWTAEDAKHQIADQFHPGAGNDSVALLLLPWNLTFHVTSFHEDYSLSPVYLLLLPLCLLVAIRNPYLRVLLITTGLYTLFWFGTAQQMRYLVPALPLLSLAAGAALEKYVFRLRWTQSPAVAPTLSGVICILLVVPGALRAAGSGTFGNSLTLGQLPPVRAKDRDEYIRSFQPLYSAVEFLNRTKGDNYTLYTLAYSNMAYFADGRFIGDWFGPARYDDLLKHLSHPEPLYQELHRLGANYFLVNQSGGWADFADDVLAPEFLNGHLKLIYAHSGLLFEVEDRAVQVAASPELLSNRGFEELSDGAPAEWLVVGKPLIDSTGINSYDGKTAVRTDDQNWLEQKVPVRSGAIYVLRHSSRASEPDQFVRLQINWLDREGNMIEVDIRVVPAETDWRSHAMAAIAPANASWADIFASVQGDSEVWFDNFSFTEINYK